MPEHNCHDHVVIDSNENKENQYRCKLCDQPLDPNRLFPNDNLVPMRTPP